MDKKLRSLTLVLRLLARIVAFVLIKVSGRQAVAKRSAVKPFRHNIVSSITSNGKVEPIAPFNIFARLDTFVEKVSVSEGQNVKKGQLLLELNVKDASSQLANAKSRLLRAQEDLRAAKAGGRTDDAARVDGDLAQTIADRDVLQRHNDSLVRLLAEGAPTVSESAA